MDEPDPAWVAERRRKAHAFGWHDNEPRSDCPICEAGDQECPDHGEPACRPKPQDHVTWPDPSPIAYSPMLGIW
jgi:hypothetical protein